jgi:hypothetical protein
MLVEGGYLDAMKKIIENAAETPNPRRDDDDDDVRGTRTRSSVFGRSFKKLTDLLRRDPAAR